MESSSPEGQPAAHRGFRRTYRIAGSVLLALTIGAATLTLVLVERWESGGGGPSELDGAEGRRGGDSPFTATMYYVAGNGLGLVRREIDVPYSADPLLRARIIVERQLERPPRRLLSAFPTGTRLRAVYLADDNLFVDLSGEVTTQHSGGSLDELLTVYALVNAVTTNVHEVAAVQILVDGREVDTLAGHIDLRQPLTPNLTWVVDLPPPPDGAPSAADDPIEPPDESAGPDEPGAAASAPAAP